MQQQQQPFNGPSLTVSHTAAKYHRSTDAMLVLRGLGWWGKRESSEVKFCLSL